MKSVYTLLVTLIAAGCLSPPDVAAQIMVSHWTGGTGPFNTASNWEFNFVPNADFDDVAIINNGGTALVTDMPTPVIPGPGALILGEGANDSGSVEVRSGGHLNVHIGIEGLGGTSGNAIVGQSGEGHLTVLRGGTFEAVNLSSGGSAASSIVLGQTGGSGTATVNVAQNASLARTTRVVGPNVDFNSSSINLDANHVLIAEITGGSHSPLKATGRAILGGALQVEFNGHAPAVGDAWNLFDAGGVAGAFSSVDSNVALPPGYSLLLLTRPGGINGQVQQLAVNVQLVLSVDRRTGVATIRNPAGDVGVDLDGYAVVSPDGTLDPMGWRSFSDDGQAGWTESNPSTRHLTELSLGGSRTIGPDGSIGLGALYDFTPTSIGQVESPVAFEYTSASGTFDGRVEFTGPHNNLVLIVDPATGEAAIQNQSIFDINLDGYAILSNSASLDPGTWISLEQGGQQGWTASNPTARHLTELNLSGGTLMAAEQGLLSLGSPFDADNASAQRDLTFQFTLTSGELLDGAVEYGPIPGPGGGIVGDFNASGLVEQGDLDLVLLNWGANTPPIPGGWTNDLPEGVIDQAELDRVLLNWGNTAAAGSLLGSASVPEPATAVLLLCAASGLLLPQIRQLRRRHAG